MSGSELLVRRPGLRWILPAVVLVVVVATGAAGRVLTADAAPSLPPRTAAQLLVDVQTATPAGFSGTVVQKSDLGLPNLSAAGAQGSSDFESMLTGTHTLRFWYGGKDRQRIALLGSLGESDVIRSGDDVWYWSSTKNTATHQRLTADTATHPSLPTPTPSTPADAAARALAAITPTTRVTTDGTAQVAGRAAYELVLTPRDTASRIGQVRLAIDAEKKIPLRVRVYAKGGTSPAFEVGFTQISYAVPEAAQFTFTPPPGAKVTERPADQRRDGKQPTVVGKGWTSVVVATGVNAPQPGDARNQVNTVLKSLPRVTGSWGKGRLLESKLLCALWTDDGRLLIGAVDPARLYQAAALHD